jgi:hypothetical protein
MTPTARSLHDPNCTYRVIAGGIPDDCSCAARDQPFDHRAEARLFLASAERCLTEVDLDREPIARALIGIGHALLAAFTDDGGYEGLPPGDTEPDSHWRNVPISEPPTKG